jgi:RNA-directed DNA polymerase
MSNAKTLQDVLPKLMRVAERAKREPETRILSLAHLVDEDLMKEAFRRIRKDAAVGVDGVTKEQYGTSGGCTRGCGRGDIATNR